MLPPVTRRTRHAKVRGRIGAALRQRDDMIQVALALFCFPLTPVTRDAAGRSSPPNERGVCTPTSEPRASLLRPARGVVSPASVGVVDIPSRYAGSRHRWVIGAPRVRLLPLAFGGPDALGVRGVPLGDFCDRLRAIGSVPLGIVCLPFRPVLFVVSGLVGSATVDAVGAYAALRGCILGEALNGLRLAALWAAFSFFHNHEDASASDWPGPRVDAQTSLRAACVNIPQAVA